jgi:cytochrome b subunit of formate dehydrogenase
MTETCPPECKVELSHIKDNIKKCEDVDEQLWEEVKMKLSQKIFFWMMGIAVVIIMATFGAIYHQGGETLVQVHAAQVEQAKIQESLKNHTEYSMEIRKEIREMRRENGHRSSP